MDTILYTDGHGTKVTSEVFVAHNSRYLIKGILDARMNKFSSSPFPALVCLCLGLMMLVLGFFHLLDSETPVLNSGDVAITASQLAMFVGFVFTAIGVITLSVRQRKYSVHITTAEGERDPVVSNKQDYVQQIVMALQNALENRNYNEDLSVRPSTP